MRRSDSPTTVPPHSLCGVARRLPSRASVFVSPTRPDAGRRPGASRCGSSQTALYREGIAGSLPLPGNPFVPMPCSWTPAGTLSHGLGERRRGPRFWQQQGLAAGMAISGLDSTAWTLAVYASPSPLRCRGRKTGFRPRSRSTGWDWLPTGLLRKVSTMYSYIPSPFPGLLWTQCQPAKSEGHLAGCPLRHNLLGDKALAALGGGSACQPAKGPRAPPPCTPNRSQPLPLPLHSV